MARDSDAMSVTVQSHEVNGTEYAKVHVPADVQDEECVCYGDELMVEIIGVDHELAHSVRFENFMQATSTLTVPVRLLREGYVETGESYEMEFDATGVTRDGVEGGSVEDEGEDEEKGLEDLFA